jgi:hypothetical protein
MNLTKDKSILELIDRLDLEGKQWILADQWDADLFAIGIAAANQPRQLVYISTFNKSAGIYHIECESPSGESDTEYVTTRRHENASFSDLLQALESHLGKA